MNLFTIADKSAELPFRELVEQYGSPLLVLDCNVLRAGYRALQDALPGVDLFYAIKSLPERAALAALAAEGANFDIATSGEIELLRSIGADPAATIHTHPIKRDQDIRDALDFGTTIFVADSWPSSRPTGPARECCCACLSAASRSNATCRASSVAIPPTSPGF
jgi:ornithine decarboxylase